MSSKGVQMIKLRTRFLVKSEQGYAVSGFPGVAIDLLYDPHLSYEQKLVHYESVTRQDTMALADISETVASLKRKTLLSLNVDPDVASPKVTDRLYLGTVHELAWFENEELTVADALALYTAGEEVSAFILLNNQAGEVMRGCDDGLRYFFHSNEGTRHNEPHVHVSYRNDKHTTIRIKDGRVVPQGILPPKAERRAVKRVLENREKFLEYWNTLTNGIHFDLNYLIENS